MNGRTDVNPHESAHLHVSGEATYIDDIAEQHGTLYAALGLSAHAHARINAMDFAAAHPLFGDNVSDALSAERSVAQRDVEGGTGPSAVRAQLEAARVALLPPPAPRSSNTRIAALDV